MKSKQKILKIVFTILLIINLTSVYLYAENPDIGILIDALTQVSEENWTEGCSVPYQVNVEGNLYVINAYGEKNICISGFGGCTGPTPCNINLILYPETEVNP